MANDVAKQQELTKAQAEAMAEYQIKLDAWRWSRRRQIGALISCVVVQVPLWWMSAVAASAIHMAEQWAGFFSIAMFSSACVFGVITVITFVAFMTDDPPRRPSLL